MRYLQLDIKAGLNLLQKAYHLLIYNAEQHWVLELSLFYQPCASVVFSDFKNLVVRFIFYSAAFDIKFESCIRYQ